MSNSNFMDAASVADFMGTSIPTAYKIIRRLNDELRKSGYITISGKVNRNYFISKVCVPLSGNYSTGEADAGI